MNLKHRFSCRICGNTHLTDVVDLGEQYLQGSFVKEGVADPSLRKIPTKLVRCDTSKNENGCGFVQMSVSTPPQILYTNYWYQSAISKTMRDHLKYIVDEASNTRRHRDPEYLKPMLKVLDIACNDGTLLSNYAEMADKTGVDPSDIAKKINTARTSIINDLYPTPKLEGEYFDIITSIAMFYDVENPIGFAQEIAKNLMDRGIWVLEVAYLPATLKQISYDTIVGEHLGYYSLSSLEHVFKSAGLRVFRAEINDVNGGSILCFVCKNEDFQFYEKPEHTAILNKIRMQEFDMELDTNKPYEIFASQVLIHKYELSKLINGLVAQGKTIHLYGASTKCNTLLQYCGFDSKTIPYAAERSPEKWGAKTLGTNIQIISEEESRKMRPDYYLVGPWHFKKEILEREKGTIDSGVGFIFPLPKIEVVEKSTFPYTLNIPSNPDDPHGMYKIL